MEVCKVVLSLRDVGWLLLHLSEWDLVDVRGPIRCLFIVGESLEKVVEVGSQPVETQLPEASLVCSTEHLGGGPLGEREIFGSGPLVHADLSK